uniref:Uncharacterized protein n=1 Tax=Meloidogyne enterolobii TaxID=390850 RepID=A0A6V7TR61_MELEN|nr:unnamed protein product [Meloidogyne enterolobii]
MALVGYFSLNKNTRNKDFSKCDKNHVNCLAFFHIMARTGASIESQEPTVDEATEES